MQHGSFVACLCAVVFLSACLAGCTGQDGGDNQNSQEAIGDLVTAKAGADSLEAALDNGTEITSALELLLQRMQNDSRVSLAAMGQDNDTVWVRFNSGIEHVFAVIDATKEEQDPAINTDNASDNGTDNSSAKLLVESFGIDAQAGMIQKAPQWSSAMKVGGMDFFNMPANNKAVVANSLTVSRPMQDSTRKMKDILESVGYQVDRVNADVKLFRNLSRYGVIYIEAHGWPSPFATPGSLLGDNSDTTCRTQGGTMILVTTTTVSDDNVSSYIPDMVCGRLRIVTVLVRQFGPPHYRARVIAVTANYIRKYDLGTFPVGAVMSLSSCRAFDTNGQSEWHDLIVEKSKHAVFIGWSKKTHWGISARAFLNLFQLATGSNEQFAVIQKNKDGSLGKGYILLEKNTPPVVPQPIASVMMSLQHKKYDQVTKGPQKGSKLQWTGDSTAETSYRILVPSITHLFVNGALSPKKSILWAMCGDNASLHIGSLAPINLGPVNSVGGGWEFTFPGLYYGTMSIHQNGRYCLPRHLLLWKPQITIVGTGPHGMTFQVQYTLRARAVIQAGDPGATWTPTTVRSISEVWKPPGINFSSVLDQDGTAVGWTVAGGATEGDLTYKYSGQSGTSVVFDSVGDRNFSSDDGKTAELSILTTTQLQYTITVTDSKLGTTTTSTASLPYSSFAITSMNLSSDLTIQSGSQADSSSGLTATISWNSAASDPIFDTNTITR